MIELRPIHEYAVIFRAMKRAKAQGRLHKYATGRNFVFAETFESFLSINSLPVFEEVMR